MMSGGVASPSSPCGLCRARFALRSCVAAPRVARKAKRGGARRDRTADLVIANDALSQLSYGPIAAASNGDDGGQHGAIYNPRQGQVKNGGNSLFPRHLPGTSLVCDGWNRYLAGSRIRDLPPPPRAHPPCVPSSTSFLSFSTSMSGC